jgi:L,D-transpeptidase ErfK/SrfK
MFILSFYGCAAMREVLVKSLPFPNHLEEKIERNDFFVAKEDDVIGRLAVIRLEKGDTLPDIARHFSLGINTVRAANPGIDIWVPEAGERIMLSLSFILPDTLRKGIVITYLVCARLDC